jgi:hypothetical protein
MSSQIIPEMQRYFQPLLEYIILPAAEGTFSKTFCVLNATVNVENLFKGAEDIKAFVA